MQNFNFEKSDKNVKIKEELFEQGVNHKEGSRQDTVMGCEYD
jgi:hypothetical protein